MIELREYSRFEMAAILKTNNKQNMTRKLERWGITYTTKGRGSKLKFTITDIADPFKVYCITELGLPAGTDFRLFRDFCYYFFNDEEFMAMPDEVKEHRLDANSKHISRQTIANYTAKLAERNLITRHSGEYIYYFAYRNTQRITDREEYLEAWHDYWKDIDAGCFSIEAICHMRAKYGGVARKQEKPLVNAIYLNEISTICDLIQESIEKDIQ